MDIKKMAKYLMITFFTVYAVLYALSFYSLIINLQAYINLRLIPFFFWLFLASFSLHFIYRDIGFLKIMFIFGVILGVFSVLFQITYNTTEYDIVKSNDHRLIIMSEEGTRSTNLKVYKRENIFVSSYHDSISVEEHYEITYEIIGDDFVITKCTPISTCMTIEINLE